jgi:hypothetical protein
MSGANVGFCGHSLPERCDAAAVGFNINRNKFPLDRAKLDRQSFIAPATRPGNAVRPNHCYFGVARCRRLMLLWSQLGWSGAAWYLRILARSCRLS